jgi:hypothetical protein
MGFSSDSQRKAAMANMNNNKSVKANRSMNNISQVGMIPINKKPLQNVGSNVRVTHINKYGLLGREPTPDESLLGTEGRIIGVSEVYYYNKNKEVAIEMNDEIGKKNINADEYEALYKVKLENGEVMELSSEELNIQ